MQNGPDEYKRFTNVERVVINCDISHGKHCKYTYIMVMAHRTNVPHIIVSIAKMSFMSWTLTVGLKFQLHKTSLNVVYNYRRKGIKEFSFYKDT